MQVFVEISPKLLDVSWLSNYSDVNKSTHYDDLLRLGIKFFHVIAL